VQIKLADKVEKNMPLLTNNFQSDKFFFFPFKKKIILQIEKKEIK
jgi:hypothetical protein